MTEQIYYQNKLLSKLTIIVRTVLARLFIRHLVDTHFVVAFIDNIASYPPAIHIICILNQLCLLHYASVDLFDVSASESSDFMAQYKFMLL